MKVKERRHRLPREFYKGEISVAFTLCLNKNIQGFIKPEIVSIFTAILSSAASKTDCIVPVYCFMPDHQHLIVSGMHNNSDIWKTVVIYKQKTGFWMSTNKTEVKWQKDFYDHILKRHEDIAVQVRYILDNPIRKGLVSSWQEYPFKGSIGCNMEDVLKGVIF